jgi:hypothetical protein
MLRLILMSASSSIGARAFIKVYEQYTGLEMCRVALSGSR